MQFAILAVALIALAAIIFKFTIIPTWFWATVAAVLIGVILTVVTFLMNSGSLRIHLIDELGTLYKRWSTQIAGIQVTAVIAWWGAVPPELKAAVPNWALCTALVVMGLGFIAAQMVKQPKLNQDGA